MRRGESEENRYVQYIIGYENHMVTPGAGVDLAPLTGLRARSAATVRGSESVPGVADEHDLGRSVANPRPGTGR